ncbi:ankyrin repeat and MYND domain-containing protein 1 isoform X2 [Scophthalmus maximus]|uniref:ankyrin repeat and MYND domain-containing protein 1 isoform X2 n=1 Tax=Scophthalmus maximus TaxID=52904 RepID=UPI001FA8DC17|nr:ankyrin repeat and MYND domain-containing protein 1 isoform X2 [Scophthalmus maximus]
MRGNSSTLRTSFYCCHDNRRLMRQRTTAPEEGGGGGGGGGGVEPGEGKPSPGHRGARRGEETPQGPGAQELGPHGDTYEGDVEDGLKHGRGKFTWSNGEYYEGSFYKQYRHGDGVYCWPTGHKFTGKFYLNRREGYGLHLFPDGATFQGLYHVGLRLGPGVVTYPDGSQDVGLWVGNRLLRLCTPVEEGFSLKNHPEYATFMDPAATTASLTQVPIPRTHSEVDADRDVLLDDDSIYPPGLERFSTNGDCLPLPPGRRSELDRHFYGELWEPDVCPYQGYERDPLSNLPLQARMQANVHNHRRQAEHLGWDVAAVLSLNRDNFGPKGPLEVDSERLIQHASRGDLQAVFQLLKTKLIHPDVADPQGHTALIAATVNCHNGVIHRLLDMGADIDKLNCEGMSALAVCHVLYYPFQSLHTTLVESPARTQVLRSPSAGGSSPQIIRVDRAADTPGLHNRPPTSVVQSREEDVDRVRREEAKGERGSVDRSIQVMDGHIAVGTVQWKECRAKPAATVQGQDEEPTQGQSFDSACSVSSLTIQVTEEDMHRAAEALSRTGLPQHADTQETVRKMAAMKIEHRARLSTLQLLLDRGADPNVSKVPVPVLILAIMAADAEAVQKLLLCGARTDMPLPPEKKGLYPLHVAAALPGPAGPRITELLLCAIIDTDAQACDQDEIFELDKVRGACSRTYSFVPVLESELETLTILQAVANARAPLSSDERPHLRGGGRTALHVACQRVSDYTNASKVVALLLSRRASTDLLWSGHSPLSLAIASGNDMVVEELLKGGADPNFPLGRGVGSAVCTLANINYHLCCNRPKLLDMLAKAGADMLLPVTVGNAVGSAVDYAHDSFNRDLRIANTPFHALNMLERETFKSRRHLLSMMGDLLRQTAGQRKTENMQRQLKPDGNSGTQWFVYTGADATSSNEPLSCQSRPHTTEKHRKPSFKFCYDCGRSVSVKLTPCSRCHEVFYCSTACKLKAWEKRHKEECVRMSASADGIRRTAAKSSKGPNLKENYTFN